MSEKPTAPIEAKHSGLDGEKSLSSPVSRETSELTDAQAMLNEIMDSSMPKIPDPPEDVTVENAADPGSTAEAPCEASGPEAPPPAPPQTNRFSSVFIYLAVLFGAAFLMLLLAYFVQQRNNESTISGMQDSWNLSRKELMEENQKLTEEKQRLAEDKSVLETQMAELQAAYDQEFNANRTRQSKLTDQVLSWAVFWEMEERFRDKDYEACAAYFTDEFTSQTYATPAEAAVRVEEIYQTLVDKKYLSEEVPLPAVYTENKTEE